jgi:hypothetical protein
MLVQCPCYLNFNLQQDHNDVCHDGKGVQHLPFDSIVTQKITLTTISHFGTLSHKPLFISLALDATGSDTLEGCQWLVTSKVELAALLRPVQWLGPWPCLGPALLRVRHLRQRSIMIIGTSAAARCRASVFLSGSKVPSNYVVLHTFSESEHPSSNLSSSLLNVFTES